ncbi:hypothetical protein N7462_007460 [Penicillium macrosclerotiorum]|uniref:uncharacterized protein n=1 Tax=Penicillium macrosclerotiorum TaxID=303699 RepID=UPI002548438A|nr:uncharacterized protein N7462_007460 [Penicillium macrosclerotiorum]KAJ5679216.1 hypothetical protein N7462_007460 [Penicillium macrosclerotiorum]
MDVGHEMPPSRAIPLMVASANAGDVNTPTSLVPGEQIRAETVQVPRSPQLQISSLPSNGCNPEFHATGKLRRRSVESSEHCSETSADSQRLEFSSASNFIDNNSNIPPSSMNDSNRSMEFNNSLSSKEIPHSTKTEQNTVKYQEVLDTPQTNGNGVVDISQPPLKLERNDEDTLPPLRSPKYSSSRSGNSSQFIPGHKRTATGDIKLVSSHHAAPLLSDTNGVSRRRSKSTGSSAYGSRIAQLSVHIRTRLSYAAAKIEKSRQSQTTSELALRGLDNLSSKYNSNSIASTLGPTPTSHPQHITNASSSSTNTPRPLLSHHRSHSAISSPGKFLQFPKLAPPVDIISSSGETPRRRPNPNIGTMKSFDRSPYARHRRHHSTQEASFSQPTHGPPTVLGPGTPHIPPSSRAATSSQDNFHRPRTQSQNTLMEQDAIETLLFMSSPENSGYRSSPRPLQPPTSQRSLNESIHSNSEGLVTHQSQGSQSNGSQESFHFKSKSLGLGLEAHAGDEIDRILDQMESDSEDDARFASHRLSVKAPFRGQNGHPK